RVYGGKQTQQALEMWTFTKVNFAKVAQDMGAIGIRVEQPGELAPAVRQALAADRPVILDGVTGIEALAPLAVGREAAQLNKSLPRVPVAANLGKPLRLTVASSLEEPAMPERKPRLRTLKAGKIVFDRRTCVIDCMVRNVSAAGACLEFPSTVGVPERFDL